MIQSMTGFGDAQLEADGHAYRVEIRSVNNRYFKAALHLPEGFAFLEPDVERLLRARLSRGSISMRVRVRDLTESAAGDLNAAAIRGYVSQLSQITGAGEGVTIDLATLATLPGVCQPHELTDAERDRAWEIVKQLTQQALERLVQMRAVEGQALAAELRVHCERIRRHVAVIRGRADTVVREYRDRLMDRVRELIADSNVRLAEEDLLKEVAIYAERSDICEELSRLEVHLAQFDEMAGGEEAAGRKLEFVAQEMLREANTIGSKSGDTQIARDIIDIKSAVDRIKEQVQNVE
jgi:uncharacterized protein (TIGR00255 family)